MRVWPHKGPEANRMRMQVAILRNSKWLLSENHEIISEIIQIKSSITEL